MEKNRLNMQGIVFFELFEYIFVFLLQENLKEKQNKLRFIATSKLVWQ